MGVKLYIRPVTKNLEAKIEELQSQVLALQEQQKTAVYSPTTVVEGKVMTPEVAPKEVEPEGLPALEEEAVFVPTQRASSGSADLKSVEKKKGTFEIKNVESLKNKKN